MKRAEKLRDIPRIVGDGDEDEDVKEVGKPHLEVVG